MEEWIRVNFTVVKDGWKTGEDSFRFVVDDREISASINQFCSRFGDTLPVSANDLINIDADNVFGWNGYFNAWKMQGLIN